MKSLLELYQLADDDNIEIHCFEMNAAESCSFEDNNGNCYIAIDQTNLENLADEKYKLAHELGHCETGYFYRRECPLQTREQCEWRAEKWAILHLVPKQELYGCMREGYREPWEIAESMNLPEDFVRKAIAYYKEQELAG